MKHRYIQECAKCDNVVVGIEKRGFFRDALRGGPGTVVEFIPVGGKLIWKVSKEIVLRLSGKRIMVMSHQESIGMNMKLQIPFNELEAFALKRYNQQVKLGFVDEKTISVTKKVVIKDATVNISVDQIAGNDISLSYQAGFGIEWIIKGALMWFKETISGFVEEQEDNKLLLHLDRIEQLNNILEKIEIKTVNFDDLNVNVAFIVK